MEWVPVEVELPPESVWVEVTGPSGYVSQPHFLALARFNPECWRDWEGVDHDPLDEVGWRPTHWRHMRKLPIASTGE